MRNTVPPTFDWKYYLENNPDLGKAGITDKRGAVQHYLTFGHKENRQICAPTQSPGIHEPLLPPMSLIRDGSADVNSFLQTGKHFLDLFVNLGKLKPTETVLDVGSAIGRMALPLTQYLRPPGKYYGFDITRDTVTWCQKNITPRYPQFIFSHCDIQNSHYNPGGRIHPANVTFDYPDNTFDFVFLTSVFTHMHRPEMERYLQEIRRVLKPGGRCLLTYFIWNSESSKLVTEGKASQPFRYHYDKYHLIDLKNVCGAVAYDESYVLDQLDKYGLQLDHPIQYGSWCQRSHPVSYQDVIVAHKI